MIDRRKFLQASIAAAVASGAPLGWAIRPAGAAPAAAGLADPATQFGAAGFRNPVPDALAPGFKFQPQMTGEYRVSVAANRNHLTGLVDKNGKRLLKTTIFGYSDGDTPTWPGKTFEVTSGPGKTEVHWANDLFRERHMLPVDTSMHWCYSLPGYEHYSIKKNGIPIITHLHGGHTDYQFDGNPEFFYSPDGEVRGPQWDNVEGGFTQFFRYDNDVPAGNLWYHDHALGITRLNVYAGLAGFYFVRDGDDTGLPVNVEGGNTLGLPAWPYEKAYAIQDRMFLESGELFYPAYPGDPFYDDFITGEGAILPPDLFPGGGPTGLAEFFGDHMVVNGIIWPFEAVEPRNYRLHLLNGTDSRFMALELYEVPAGATDIVDAEKKLSFDVIGSDQGLASGVTTTQRLLSEPGSRYDVVVDFSQVTAGNRVIMWNQGGDEPFGGDIPGPQAFSHTNRVMAFDVVAPFDMSVPDASPVGINLGPSIPAPTRLRKVALFEGKDEFGRLQPLLGTAEPATDCVGNPINWPDKPVYESVGLVGQMEGSIAWHSPTTENPALGSTEEWEVWNVTGDAHPVHLHLVHFEVLGRQEIVWDDNVDEDGFIPEGSSPAGNGTYLVPQPTVQHNSVAGDSATYGQGFRIVNPTAGGVVNLSATDGYVENAPKDMVTALPGQVTRIKATFDKPGRYVWHCHILSHEDHEMMRVLHVGPEA
jgi:spore coat protein A